MWFDCDLRCDVIGATVVAAQPLAENNGANGAVVPQIEKQEENKTSNADCLPIFFSVGCFLYGTVRCLT